MKMIKMTCTNCGAGLDIDIDNLIAFCPHCGQKLLFDMDQMEIILAARERTKQVQLQEETKRLQATEARKRMELAEEIEDRKRKRKLRNRAIAIVILIFFIIAGPLLSQTNDDDRRKDGYVQPPHDAAALINEEYQDVELMFKDAGFESITLVPRNDISADKISENGKVISVSIQGETHFSQSTWVQKDARVEIRYHSISD